MALYSTIGWKNHCRTTIAVITSSVEPTVKYLCVGVNPPCCDVDWLKPPVREKAVTARGADANPSLVANPVLGKSAPDATPAAPVCAYGTTSSNAANGLDLPFWSISSIALYYSPRCLHSVIFKWCREEKSNHKLPPESSDWDYHNRCSKVQF